jgi:hypothetical protein
VISSSLAVLHSTANFVARAALQQQRKQQQQQQQPSSRHYTMQPAPAQRSGRKEVQRNTAPDKIARRWRDRSGAVSSKHRTADGVGAYQHGAMINLTGTVQLPQPWYVWRTQACVLTPRGCLLYYSVAPHTTLPLQSVAASHFPPDDHCNTRTATNKVHHCVFCTTTCGS